MEEVMDVPPLEDMSEILQKVLNIKEIKSQCTLSDKCSSLPVKSDSEKCEQEDMTKQRPELSSCQNSEKKTDKAKEGFGGMKKGFLFASKPKTSAEKCSDKLAEDLPYIRPNKENQYQFSEVQQAMDLSSSLSLNKDWLTDDLLQRLQSSPDLLKRIADPTFMNAIAEFQLDPQSAMLKYRDNAAIQSFFKEFCGLLGDHFSSLETPQNTPATKSESSTVHVHSPEGAADLTVVSSKSQHRSNDSDDDARVKDIVSDPVMREILLDSRIQRLMEALRTDPQKAQMIIERADAELKSKIGRLVQTGLLQFQT